MPVCGTSVLVCRQHGSCYVQNTMNRHLAEQHHIKRPQRLTLSVTGCQEGISTEGRTGMGMPAYGYQVGHHTFVQESFKESTRYTLTFPLPGCASLVV